MLQIQASSWDSSIKSWGTQRPKHQKDLIHCSCIRASCFMLLLQSWKASKTSKRHDPSFFFPGIHVSNFYCCHQKMLDDSGENHQRDLIHHSFFREFMFQTSIAVIKKMLDDSGENMKKIWSIVALSDGGQHQPTAGLDQKENKRCWLSFFLLVFSSLSSLFSPVP